MRVLAPQFFLIFLKKLLTNGILCAIIIDVVWLVGQAVKTPASHAGNEGSIPSRVTYENLRIFNRILRFFYLFC